MSGRLWLQVAVFLAPPWTVFAVACYWMFLDAAPPLRVVYQHDKFISREVDNREDARKYEIESADSGGFVWAYREICVDRMLWGSARGSWVAGSFVWQTPERAVTPLPLGCHAHTFNLRVPTSNPTRDFSYQVEWVFENNPLVTSVVRMDPINLRVYATGEAPTKMEPKP